MTTKILLIQKGEGAFKIIYNGREAWEPENMTLKELWQRYEEDDRPPYEAWNVNYEPILVGAER